MVNFVRGPASSSTRLIHDAVVRAVSRKAAEEFAQLNKRFKTSAAVIGQEKNLGQYLKGLKAGFIAHWNPPEFCKEIPEDAWVV